MGEIKIKISDEIERKFREMAMKNFGYSKGSISQAAQKAIADWIVTNIKIEIIEDPIKSISGLMKKVKKTSLELQHEAWKDVN
jgi:bifunctional pyridoxal-dependent enzyme with beta-cystathionase and maltose regulon repressor activities